MHIPCNDSKGENGNMLLWIAFGTTLMQYVVYESEKLLKNHNIVVV